MLREAARPLVRTLRLCAPSGNSKLRAGVVEGAAGRREEPAGSGSREGGVGGAGAGRFLSSPSPAGRQCSPLVQGHDGHARRRCHPGWRGPRALPALQSELRPHGQGGWASSVRPPPSSALPLPGCVWVGLSPFPQAAGSPRGGRERESGHSPWGRPKLQGSLLARCGRVAEDRKD